MERIEKGMEIYHAGIHARSAQDYFFTAHNIREFSENRAMWNFMRGIEELKTVAEILGYEIIIREPPAARQEAA